MSRPNPRVTTVKADEGSGSQPDVSYHFRVAMLGDARVGKTSLLLRYTEDDRRTPTDYSEDSRTKMLVRHGHLVKLDVRDTAGLERYRSLTRSHYIGITGALLVFDLTSEHSFLHLTYWQQELDKHAGDTVPCILVGTNCHKREEREVSEERARQFADHHSLQYVEVSAAENVNVEHCFESLVDRIVERQAAKIRVPGKDRVQLMMREERRPGEGTLPSRCCASLRFKEQP